ncbi:hypothetical protein FHX44_116927 [Pseudonocardia hierapolitana]|uniref:Uncharacterized protein n=1 Tax=Pseudonocardia hierapolitana TaxID=1128676 RepID=A0A561T1J7_9PSEU|nr:hypothetical protein [Pseudonocardia hierapolitana]TWF80984.1 hypothetical protein FHX44_116927 [Pseudonocardia hierapolitana]
MSVLVVLIGGAEDGRQFRVPNDDPIATSGVLALPEVDAPSQDDPVADEAARATFTLLRYRWDGTVREDGARRYRLEGR